MASSKHAMKCMVWPSDYADEKAKIESYKTFLKFAESREGRFDLVNLRLVDFDDGMKEISPLYISPYRKGTIVVLEGKIYFRDSERGPLLRLSGMPTSLVNYQAVREAIASEIMSKIESMYDYSKTKSWKMCRAVFDEEQEKIWALYKGEWRTKLILTEPAQIEVEMDGKGKNHLIDGVVEIGREYDEKGTYAVSLFEGKVRLPETFLHKYSVGAKCWWLSRKTLSDKQKDQLWDFFADESDIKIAFNDLTQVKVELEDAKVHTIESVIEIGRDGGRAYAISLYEKKVALPERFSNKNYKKD